VLTEEVADPLRQVEPRLVPGPDQAVAPLALDDVVEAGHGGLGEAAEGVAVEVDEVFVGDDEPVAEGGQGVGGVSVLGFGAGVVCTGCSVRGCSALGGRARSRTRVGSSSRYGGPDAGRPA